MAITIENLRKTFIKDGNRIEVLKGLDLEIADGESLALVGVSGAGKSTIARLLHAAGATVLTDERPVVRQWPTPTGDSPPLAPAACPRTRRNRRSRKPQQNRHLCKQGRIIHLMTTKKGRIRGKYGTIAGKAPRTGNRRLYPANHAKTAAMY